MTASPGSRSPSAARSTPPAIDGMQEARRPTGPVVAIIVSVLVMVLGQLPFTPLLQGTSTQTFEGQLLLTTTFIGPMLLLFAWVRLKEKRPIASLGFRRPAVRQIVIGAAVGLALTSATVLINVAMGTATLGDVSANGVIVLLTLVLLVGFAIQASTEEVVDRGFLLQAVARRWGLVAALVIQAAVFAGLHGANGGLTWVAWANLVGVAVFLGLWVWVTGNLWGACAFHTVWNWSQGNLWGAPISHNQASTSIANYTPTDSSATLLTGGDFGLEGSVLPLIAFIVGSVILIIAGRRLRG